MNKILFFGLIIVSLIYFYYINFNHNNINFTKDTFNEANEISDFKNYKLDRPVSEIPFDVVGNNDINYYEKKGVGYKNIIEDLNKQYGIYRYTLQIDNAALTSETLLTKNDIILLIDIISYDERNNGRALIVYTYDSENDCYNKALQTPLYVYGYQIMDFNSDGISELIINEGHYIQRTESRMLIYRFENNLGILIFNEGLEKVIPNLNYSYKNSYEFIYDSVNSKTDIKLNCTVYNYESEFKEKTLNKEGDMLFKYNDQKQRFEVIGEIIDYEEINH